MNATPIIPGFHPDPSICRVGEDFYLVNSTFEYLPGVPIFHSSNLVAWKQVSNVLDRADQLTLPSSAGGCGIYAPTIRHHGGQFWMITSNMNQIRNGHLIVRATDPSGPWSTPVFTSGAVGIDPDLFWDADGTCYLTWAAGWGEYPIMQATVDPTTGKLLSAPYGLTQGSGLAHPEGPHLYHRGDWYYLLLAEGGTERGHAVTIARSHSVQGPFEWNPANPILSHRSTTHPVQNTGHADLVETAQGWAMVYLGVRPVGPSPSFHLNGRETFIARVTWVDDWPVVDDDAFEISETPSRFSDDFTSDELDGRWIAPGRHPRDFTAPAVGGGLAIQPSDTAEYRSLLAIRVEDQAWEARATTECSGARLVLRLDDAHWAAVESRGDQIIARAVAGPFDQEFAVMSISTDSSPTVTLAIRSTQPKADLFGTVVSDNLHLGWMRDNEFRTLATIDGRYISTEVAGGFTGRVIGVEPLPGQPGPAVLYEFSYKGL